MLYTRYSQECSKEKIQEDKKIILGLRLLSWEYHSSRYIPHILGTFIPKGYEDLPRHFDKPDTLKELCVLVADSITKRKKIDFKKSSKAHSVAFLSEKPLPELTDIELINVDQMTYVDDERYLKIMTGVEIIDEPGSMAQYLDNIDPIRYLNLCHLSYMPSIPLIKLCEILGEAYASHQKIRAVTHIEEGVVDGGYVSLELCGGRLLYE